MTTQHPRHEHAPVPCPATAAKMLTEAAGAATAAWTRPMTPAGHAHATRQLYSAIRDLGITIRVLSRQCGFTSAAEPGSPDSARRVLGCARLLLRARTSLDSALIPRSSGQGHQRGGPGSAMCRAARDTLATWQHPRATQADLLIAAEQLTHAINALAAVTDCLATRATPPRRGDLQNVHADLSAASECLRGALQFPDESPVLNLHALTDRLSQEGMEARNE